MKSIREWFGSTSVTEISSEMYLTGKAGKNADKNSRQQEQNSTMMQLVDCKDELNMAMLKVICLFFFFF